MSLRERPQELQWDHGTGGGREPLTAHSTVTHRAWATPAPQNSWFMPLPTHFFHKMHMEQYKKHPPNHKTKQNFKGTSGSRCSDPLVTSSRRVLRILESIKENGTTRRKAAISHRFPQPLHRLEVSRATVLYGAQAFTDQSSFQGRLQVLEALRSICMYYVYTQK